MCALTVLLQMALLCFFKFWEMVIDCIDSEPWEGIQVAVVYCFDKCTLCGKAESSMQESYDLFVAWQIVHIVDGFIVEPLVVDA